MMIARIGGNIVRNVSQDILRRNIAMLIIKRLKAPVRAYQLLIRKKRIPQSIYIFITTRCNLQCKGCISNDFHGTDMACGDIMKTAESFISRGTVGITFLGGEPFLPVIRDNIFCVAEAYPFTRVFVFTNGTLLDDILKEKICSCPNLFIIISFDGDAQSNDFRRGNGVYGKILDFCAFLKEEKILFGFSCTINAINFSHALSNEYVRFLNGLGAIHTLFFPYCPTGCTYDPQFQLSANDYCEMSKRIKALNRIKGNHMVCVDAIRAEKSLQGCRAGDKNLTIMANGDVQPCPGMHYSYANIFSDGLDAVLHSPFIEDVVKLKRRHRGCLVADHPDTLSPIIKKHKHLLSDTTGVTRKVLQNGGIFVNQGVSENHE